MRSVSFAPADTTLITLIVFPVLTLALAVPLPLYALPAIPVYISIKTANASCAQFLTVPTVVQMRVLAHPVYLAIS